MSFCCSAEHGMATKTSRSTKSRNNLHEHHHAIWSDICVAHLLLHRAAVDPTKASLFPLNRKSNRTCPIMAPIM